MEISYSSDELASGLHHLRSLLGHSDTVTDRVGQLAEEERMGGDTTDTKME